MMGVAQNKWAFRLALVSLIMFALLPIAGRSSYFLRPVEIVVNEANTHFVFVRKLPFGAIVARWKAEIFVPATADECAAMGEDPFEPRPNDTVRIPVRPVFLPCLDQPGVKVMTAQWTVILFRMVPAAAGIADDDNRREMR